MTTTATPVSPRLIALTHYASRALLENVLARHGATFNQSVTMRAVLAGGDSIGRDQLVSDVTGSLKTDASVVHGVIEELAAASLLETDPATTDRVRLTDAGRELFETTSAETAPISARVYGDIPAEELETAGRVLTLIMDRATAELTRS
jgi:DNA-binding MarR family transcriptional regulator